MSETVIKPQKNLSIDLKELWQYKELFYFFAWRDIKVRYKQTVIGAAWAIFQPFITMVIFTLFFNKVAGIGSESVPYAIFSYSGLLFWQFFSKALDQASNSLVNNQGVVTKIYFPRIIAPLASTLVALIDFFFASIIFVGLMAYFKIVPGGLGLILFLPMILVTFITASGAGLFLATLNVKYRDVRQALPFFIQTMLFLTPVIYPVSMVPERFQWVLYLNPMTGVITAIRHGLLHEGTLNWAYLAISIVSCLVIFIIGLLYFKSQERKFADII
ncbi:MAG TPA: ABC transporter permease [Candidatus Dormibacteraeota bacterium]|nr:ABC transporter permease [Candidatus Dormibacteraeota bacterium]